MIGRRRVVLVAVVGVSNDGSVPGRSQAARISEVMVAERNGEVQRKRG
jgi:hypothetical protein